MAIQLKKQNLSIRGYSIKFQNFKTKEMKKHSLALGFGVIGAGIGGFLSADCDNGGILYVIMGACFGIFIGYFIAGLLGAKSSLLQKEFQNLGNLRGLTIDEIVAAVGQYQSFNTCTITDHNNELGKQYTWSQDSYSITLLFGADGKCIGISNEKRI